MKFAGKVYSGDILLGNICADSMTSLKKIASRKCNRYFKSIDTMVLHQANNKEVNNLTLVRVNRKSPNNTIIRGQWK